MIEIYFDGACEPINPGGTASYGWLIKKDRKIIAKDAKILGAGKGMTNNIAEYAGLIAAIKTIPNLKIKDKIRICGDSDLVCNMISKKWGWKKKKWSPHKRFPHLKVLLDEALNLLENYDYEVKWLSREQNQEADALSKKVLIEAGIIKPDSEIKPCPSCKGRLVIRNGKFGKFYGCSNYPKCQYTEKVKI